MFYIKSKRRKYIFEGASFDALKTLKINQYNYIEKHYYRCNNYVFFQMYFCVES